MLVLGRCHEPELVLIRTDEGVGIPFPDGNAEEAVGDFPFDSCTRGKHEHGHSARGRCARRSNARTAGGGDYPTRSRAAPGGSTIEGVVIRNRALRWPIPRGVAGILSGQRMVPGHRRAKYLLIHCERGTLIVHLGMSGSLRIVTGETPIQKHDHFDLQSRGGRHHATHRSTPVRRGAVELRRARAAQAARESRAGTLVGSI